MELSDRYKAKLVREHVWRVYDWLFGTWIGPEGTAASVGALAAEYNTRYTATEARRAHERAEAMRRIPPCPTPAPAPPLGHTRVSRPSAIFAAVTRPTTMKR